MLYPHNSFNISLWSLVRMKWMRHKRLLQYVLYLLPAYILFNNFGYGIILNYNNGEVVNAGSLTVGVIVSGVITAILAARVTSSKETNFYFSFPISRQLYAIGSFIFTVMTSVYLLLVTCFALVFEQLLGRITYILDHSIVIVDSITMYNLYIGLIVSLYYILFIASFVSLINCISILSIKYSVAAVVILGLLISSSIGRKVLLMCLGFLTEESSIVVLILKLTLLTLSAQCCIWLLLRRREITK